jgi:hypothetical protein
MIVTVTLAPESGIMACNDDRPHVHRCWVPMDLSVFSSAHAKAIAPELPRWDKPWFVTHEIPRHPKLHP